MYADPHTPDTLIVDIGAGASERVSINRNSEFRFLQLYTQWAVKFLSTGQAVEAALVMELLAWGP